MNKDDIKFIKNKATAIADTCDSIRINDKNLCDLPAKQAIKEALNLFIRSIAWEDFLDD